jgi:hypothetical protein
MKMLPYLPSFFEFTSPLDEASQLLRLLLERKPTDSGIFFDYKSRSGNQLSHRKQVYYPFLSLNQQIEIMDVWRKDLSRFRLLADPEMDHILDLFSAQNNGHRLQSLDIITALEQVYSSDDSNISIPSYNMAVQKFYQHYYHLKPSLIEDDSTEEDFLKNIDWNAIQRGMDVFITYSPVIAMSLYYLSLIPGFSIPLINKVLQETKYLAPPSPLERVRTRLMDTGAFLAYLMVHETSNSECTLGKETEGKNGHEPRMKISIDNTSVPALPLRPGGRGWKMALRIRCLHAKVRRSLLTSAHTWDTETYGIPINQEDMAATLLAFSLNVIYGIEFVAGTSISNVEKHDYMVLWRYVGWLLGVDIHLDPCNTRYVGCHSKIFPTEFSNVDPLFHSRLLMESILSHIMQPDESSVAMAHHLLQIPGPGVRGKTLKTPSARPGFMFLYRGFICRRFIGDDLSNQLRLPDPRFDFSLIGLLAFIYSYLVLLVLRCYVRLIIHYPTFRHKAYNWHYHGLRRFLLRWENPKSGTIDYSAALFCPYYSRNINYKD